MSDVYGIYTDFDPGIDINKLDDNNEADDYAVDENAMKEYEEHKNNDDKNDIYNVYSEYLIDVENDDNKNQDNEGYGAYSEYVVDNNDSGNSEIRGRGESVIDRNAISLFQNHPILKEPDRKWNEQFQNLLNLSYNTPEEELNRYSKIYKFVREFTRYARELGKIIISESHLSNDDKVIKSVDVGGIAGGEKFITKGIFFKRVSDQHNLYGGLTGAMRAAGLELNGLKRFVNCGINELRYPLMCLIDYQGTRLTASSIAPINSTTLSYGSNDAGKTVHCDPDIHKLMSKACGEGMNLKPHIVGREQNVELYGPVDIEVHKGLDNRYYVLDTARLMPPVPPKLTLFAILIGTDDKEQIQYMNIDRDNWRLKVEEIFKKNETEIEFSNKHLSGVGNGILCTHATANKNEDNLNKRASNLMQNKIYDQCLWIYTPRGEFLYHHLRPELIKQFSKPISSDSWAMFGSHNADIHNAEATEAYEYLFNTVIPDFSKKLLASPPSDIPSLHKRMHAAGINTRYYGHVRKHVVPEEGGLIADSMDRIRIMIITDMASRFIKSYLRYKLRRSQSLKIQRKVILDYLNLIFGSSTNSANFWKVTVLTGMQVKFEGHVFDSYDKLSVFTDPRAFVDMGNLLLLVQRTTGARLQKDTVEKISKNVDVMLTEKPFNDDDLYEIEAEVTGIGWDPYEALAVVDNINNQRSDIVTELNFDINEDQFAALTKQFLSTEDIEYKTAEIINAVRYANMMTSTFQFDVLFHIRGQLRMANANLELGNVEGAKTYMENIWDQLKERLVVRSPLLIGALLLYGRIIEAAGMAKENEEEKEELLMKAFNIYDECEKEIMALYGDVNETRVLSDISTDDLQTSEILQQRYFTITKGHPIRLVVGNAKVRVSINMKSQKCWYRLSQTIHKVDAHLRVFPFDVTRNDILRRVFNDERLSLFLYNYERKANIDEEVLKQYETKVQSHMHNFQTHKNTEQFFIKGLTLDSWIFRVAPFFYAYKLPGGYSTSNDGDTWEPVEEQENKKQEVLEKELEKRQTAPTISYEELCKIQPAFRIIECAHCHAKTLCKHGSQTFHRMPIGTYYDEINTSQSAISHSGAIKQITYHRSVLLNIEDIEDDPLATNATYILLQLSSFDDDATVLGCHENVIKANLPTQPITQIETDYLDGYYVKVGETNFETTQFGSVVKTKTKLLLDDDNNYIGAYANFSSVCENQEMNLTTTTYEHIDKLIDTSKAVHDITIHELDKPEYTYNAKGRGYYCIMKTEGPTNGIIHSVRSNSIPGSTLIQETDYPYSKGTRKLVAYGQLNDELVEKYRIINEEKKKEAEALKQQHLNMKNNNQ